MNEIFTAVEVLKFIVSRQQRNTDTVVMLTQENVDEAAKEMKVARAVRVRNDKKNDHKRTVKAKVTFAAADEACDAFLGEAVEFGEFETRAGELYAACAAFCARTGRKTPSVRAFGSRMRERFEARRSGRKGPVSYLGGRAHKGLDAARERTIAEGGGLGDENGAGRKEIP